MTAATTPPARAVGPESHAPSPPTGRARSWGALPRILGLVPLCCGPLLAGEPPPRNQIPIQAEVDRLRTTVKDQQGEIAKLLLDVAQLAEKSNRLEAAQATQQERAGAIAADLERCRAQADELRRQVAALEQGFLKLKGNKKELVGAWKVVSVEEDGAPRPKAIARLVFAARSVTFQYQEPGRQHAYAYKLDPTEEPKEIDVNGVGSRPTPGIYDLQGDRLTLCISTRRNGRPTELLSRPGSGTTLYVLEREAPSPGEGPPSTPANAPSPPR